MSAGFEVGGAGDPPFPFMAAIEAPQGGVGVHVEGFGVVDRDGLDATLPTFRTGI